jgi:riboflavin biosynthesis pyrimidine reductase
VSREFAPPVDIGVFNEPGTPIRVFTDTEGAQAPAVAADVVVRRVQPLTLEAVIDALGDEGARSVLCEGGPRLLRDLVAAGRLDDLLLTVSPMLVAGDAPAILTGPALPDPARLQLADVHRADDHLFLHYRHRA